MKPSRGHIKVSNSVKMIPITRYDVYLERMSSFRLLIHGCSRSCIFCFITQQFWYLSDAPYVQLLSYPSPTTAVGQHGNANRCGWNSLRLTGSFLMRRVSSKAAKYLQSVQVRIATRSGADAVVHGIRRMVQEYGSSSYYGMLAVDLMNEFNLCIRSAFFQAVSRILPKLLPWVSYSYTN